jgi:uncharacterized protein (TIGR03382 family)
MPPRDGEARERVEFKYMGCVEKTVTTPVVPDASPAAPAASPASNVPAVPAEKKCGCSSTGSGTTSFLGASLVAGLLWQLRRRRLANK